MKLFDESHVGDVYIRGTYTHDMIYTFYDHRGLHIMFSRGDVVVRDETAEKAVREGRFAEEQLKRYYRRIIQFVVNTEISDKLGVRGMEETILDLRREILGDFCAENGFDSKDVLPNGSVQDLLDLEKRFYDRGEHCVGVFQRDLFIQKSAGADQILLIVEDPEYEKTALCLVSDHRKLRVVHIRKREELDLVELPDDRKTLVIFAGENGLLDAENLNTDCFILAHASGYYTKPLVNFVDGLHFVYLPKHTDLTRYVPLWKKTRCTYYHWDRLYRRYGEEIYDETVETLYRKYPQTFCNIYENRGRTFPVDPELLQVPETTADEKVFEVYDELREKALERMLNEIPGMEYKAECLNSLPNLSENTGDGRRYPEGFHQKECMRVRGIRISEKKDLQAIQSDGSSNFRELMMEQGGIHILSNYLFFLTPKVKLLYNKQRVNRKNEQIHIDSGHMDYRLSSRQGVREESFSLYNKAAMAVTRDGQISLFDLKTERGKLRLFGKELSFRTAVEEETSACAIVYLPYLSLDDPGSDEYTLSVGDGRTNFVVIQNQLIAVSDEAVLLPCCGAVISVDRETAKEILNAREKWEEEEPAESPVEIFLDDERTRNASWALGGGMLLIQDGSDTDLDWLIREGWMSVLSRQTQDTAVEKPARHPRTAVGVTKNGDFCIMTIDGRCETSMGADYDEMRYAARKLWPDIESLMNVDGGGSTQLGISVDGQYMELNLPATSSTNVAGMGRNIHTGIDVTLSSAK